MEIHQLRYFVAVADEGSFSRAAAKVRVAQPSLSQQIRKLEAEIGQPLFDRLPRSVVLTEAGRCFLDYARQILASIGDARRCVDELNDAVTGKLAVGAIPTIAPFLLLHEMHCLSQQVHHLLESRRLRPEIGLAGSQLTTIAHMVGAGIGVSIVPHMMVKHQETPGCVSLPFAPPVPERELNFLHNPLRFQTKAAAAFHREAAALLSGDDSSIADDAKN